MTNTREKLIELLITADDYEVAVCKEYPCKYCKYRGEDCTYKARADHLITNGVTVQKWIPVTERLPEGECLAVSMLTGPAYEEMLIGYVSEASNWDTGYECESDGEILPNVTHWMPLPEAPKGE